MGCKYCDSSNGKYSELLYSESQDMMVDIRKGELRLCDCDDTYVRKKINYCPMCGCPLNCHEPKSFEEVMMREG